MHLKKALKRGKKFARGHYREVMQSVQNRRIVAEAIRGGAPIRLELGAARRRIDGWIAIDQAQSDITHDLTTPLPFPAGSVDEIYSSAVLEHFYYHELMKLLEDCRRVLRPGGLFHCGVPDVTHYIDAYLGKRTLDPRKFCRYEPGRTNSAKLSYLNYIAYLGGHHKLLFDAENIQTVLQDAGFHEVKMRDFDPSIDLEERRHEMIYAAGYR